MPGYVPGFEHDVFVSYAHVDNELGWVSKLVKGLEVRLAERLGRPHPSVWIDHQIRGNESLEQIFRSIRKAASLMLIKSPGYFKSDWCREEMLTFIATQSSEGNRVFAVNTDQHDPARCPDTLRKLTGYDFWTVDDESRICMRLGMPETADQDAKYYKQLARLAAQLAETLEAAASKLREVSDTNRSPRVFLAELPDDALEPQRSQIEEAFRQASIEVISADPQLTTKPVDFESWARSVLPSCRAFVQLLNQNSGKTRASVRGLPVLQFQLAAEAKTPRIIQWRSADLALDSIANDQHRALLQHESVRTCGLHELISEVLKVINAEEKPQHEPVSVFVNSDLCDRELGERVEQQLKGKGVTAELPPAGAKPRAVREFLVERLLSCDAAFVVHRQSDWAWVNEQINQVAEKNLVRRRLVPPRCPVLVGLLTAHKLDGEMLDADVEELQDYHVAEEISDVELNAVLDEFVAKLQSLPHGSRPV